LITQRIGRVEFKSIGGTDVKIIGLLGGMSWESSAIYYQAINERIKEKLGGHNSAEILMYSVNFQQIKELQYKGEWEKAKIGRAHV
jgi:aspartate racemase